MIRWLPPIRTAYPELESFKSCVGHIIYGSSNATTQTNYPVRITISPGVNMTADTTNMVVCLPHVHKNLSDLVIVNQWGQKLNHWVEYPTYRTDGKLDVWVKIPTLAQNQIYPLYILFGRANTGINTKGGDYPYYNSASAAGKLVFEKFDHFEGSSLDSNMWTVSKTSGADTTATVSGSVLSVRTKSSSANYILVYTSMPSSLGYAIRAYYKTDFNATPSVPILEGLLTATSTVNTEYKNGALNMRMTYTTPRWRYYTGSALSVSMTNFPGGGVWGVFDINMYSTGEFVSNINNVQETYQTGLATFSTPIAKLTAYQGPPYTNGIWGGAYADWFVLRPCVYPEPTHGITWTVW